MQRYYRGLRPWVRRSTCTWVPYVPSFTLWFLGLYDRTHRRRDIIRKKDGWRFFDWSMIGLLVVEALDHLFSLLARDRPLMRRVLKIRLLNGPNGWKFSWIRTFSIHFTPSPYSTPCLCSSWWVTRIIFILRQLHGGSCFHENRSSRCFGNMYFIYIHITYVLLQGKNTRLLKGSRGLFFLETFIIDDVIEVTNTDITLRSQQTPTFLTNVYTGLNIISRRCSSN